MIAERKARGEERIQVIDLPFDHYGRYELTQRVVSLLWPRPPRRGLRVLDVGGHSSSLKFFLPQAHVTLADLKPPAEYTHRPTIPFRFDAYVRASGAALPFPDGTFDLVTSHDTLEHVPERLKRDFLVELARVSRRFVILNGPLRERHTLQAEERVIRWWRRGLEWERHPLEEHVEARLPKPGLIDSFLRSMRTPYTTIPNGDIDRWTLLMVLKSYLQALPETEDLDVHLDRTHNTLFAGDRDIGGQTYRVAYVIAKDRRDAHTISRVRTRFRSAIRAGERRPDLNQEAIVRALEDNVLAVRRLIAGYQTEIQRLSDSARARDELLAARDELLAHKDALIRLKEVMAARMRDELQASLAEVRVRDDELWRLGERAKAGDEAYAELERIRGSAGYRLIFGLKARLDRWFPAGTIRGWPYRAVLTGIRRLVAWRLRGRTHSDGGVPDLTPGYAEWIARNEPGEADLVRQHVAVRRGASRPLISIVMPVWNPEPRLLQAAIRSVSEQSYDRWELCVADGGSAEEVRRVLREAAAKDARVRVRFLEENLGISGNTNEALTLARGPFIAFLDHTDELAPFALAEVATAVWRDPSLDVLYSGHDLITPQGVRHSPFLPGGFAPETLLAANYMAHLRVIRRSLIDEVGPFRASFDGAQDWDLLLRVSERTDRVVRLPGILYHWRTDESSAAESLQIKPYAADAQEAAVREHLVRRGESADVERHGGQVRVRWRLQEHPKVSIIIPTRHNREFLDRSLRAIARSSYPEVEVIVVETAGTDHERAAWYDQAQQILPFRVLWWDEPFNYSAVNNAGAREASGDVLLFLNDDTEPVGPDWIEEMVGWLQRGGVGIVGAQLLGPDDRIQHGGVIVGLGGFADHLFRGMRPGDWSLVGSTMWVRNVSAVTGACLMVRRSTFETLGGWDEDFVLCGSDVELCLRAVRSGLRVVCTPFAPVRHLESATRGTYVPPEDFGVSFWHYQPLLYGGDPYFHPALSLADPVPRLSDDHDVGPLEVVSEVLGRDLRPKGPSDPFAEAVGFARGLHATQDQIDAVRRLHEETEGFREVTSINWFIPDFESPFYGGIHTIFRFANHFLECYGVKSRFVVIGTGPESFIRSGIRVAFPGLADAEVIVCATASDDELYAIPPSDVAIATLWVTAYPVLRFPHAARKFSFMQDFEPIFYAAGTVHALAEQTYRMHLYGICNTRTLERIYRDEYGGVAVGYDPAVDPIFHARERPQRQGPKTIFFYGRPGHPRNCYELAIHALSMIKDEFGDDVRIVTAGSWSTAAPGTDASFVEQLGLLGYEETARLYRSCDIGLSLSVSKHPSYLPLQLMASGCLVVSNENPAAAWLLRHEENCLLAPPTGEALASALRRGLTDDALRATLAGRGAEEIDRRYRDWDAAAERTFGFMRDPRR